MKLTPELESKAQRAARDAFLNDRFGHGTHDWQDAEVAACTVLQNAGFSNDDAYETGREIAARQVTIIEDAESDRYESETHENGGPERFRDFSAI